MTSVVIQFEKSTLREVDEAATRRGVSRDEFVAAACRKEIEKPTGWPEEFFDNSGYSPEDLDDLRAAGDEMEQEIYAARRSRDAALL